MTVEVVLPLPLEQSYTYEVPQALAAEVQVGCRVLVSFGPRRLTGVAVEQGVQTPDGVDELKPVLDVLDEEPALTEEMLGLTRWMADYYVCGWGEVVKAALPSGTDVKGKRWVSRTDRPAGGAWTDHQRARAVLEYLEEHDRVSVKGLRQAVGQVSLALLRRLEKDGLLEMEKALSREVQAKYEKHLRFAPPFRHDGAPKELKEQLRGHKQRAVIEVLAGFRAEGTAEPRQQDVKARADASSSTVKSLIEKGMVEVVEKEVIRTPLGEAALDDQEPEQHDFHPAQQQALDAVAGAVEADEYRTFLLKGVTGSGKTAVYIAALKRVLERGKTGIIMVPEIALTPQTVKRFRAHFGDRIAVLHSQMSQGERYDAWRGLRSGRFDVVIGPRSAVLAPLSDLGLIVVDEEHESSYKQFDPAPRYHARDVAVMRAHMNEAVCVLGSATPCLESVMNTRGGKYTLLEMPDRVPVAGVSASMPEVRVIDLVKERKKHRLEGVLSEPLQEAIQGRLQRREQVILLQNRRGYAPVVECEGCGWSPSCGDCSVTMTYHKAKRQLRCHYCGRARRLPRVCPQCEEKALTQLGTGTQRVAEELRAHFPEAVVLRMDRDTTSRKNAHRKLLDQFGRGDADVLVGTQMVAKGLDFSRVTLVGVVNADAGLLLPDFRAEEHTFQLLTQVAGRAGRAELAGEVLLQTRNPDNKVLHHAKTHDYDSFAEEALAERRQFDYPPFGRMVSIQFRGSEKKRVEQVGEEWTAALRRRGSDVQVMGPEPALVARVKRKYRYQTIVKAARPVSGGRLQEMVRHASRDFGSPPNGYHIAVDVDPVGLF